MRLHLVYLDSFYIKNSITLITISYQLQSKMWVAKNFLPLVKIESVSVAQCKLNAAKLESVQNLNFRLGISRLKCNF